MIAFHQAALGVVWLHVIWLFCFVLGTLTRPELKKERRPSDDLSELVVASVTGFALCGFWGFVVAALGLFYWWTLPLVLVLTAATAAYRGASIFSIEFWRERFGVIRGSITLPTVVMYLLAVALAIPASLPDVAFDSNMIHLPYAYDWSRDHGLSVDYWLRYPYYVMNWQLLYAWLFNLGIGDFSSILSALCGLLTVLGIQAAVLTAFDGKPGAQWPNYVKALVTVAAPAMLLLSPTFLRWVITSMVDVPIGLFFLTTALIVGRALDGARRDAALPRLIVCAGFFIGLKATFFFFAPLFGFYVARIAYQHYRSRAAATVALAALLILAAPWYAKAFIQAGDPVSPYLNLKFHGVDPKFSAYDWQGVEQQLTGVRDANSLLRLPVRIFLHTNTEMFREYGVTAVWMLLYAPFASLGLMILWRRYRRLMNPMLTVFTVFTAFGVIYWLATSYAARYSLLFVPALCVFVALWLLNVGGRNRIAQVAVTAALFLGALPNASSYEWISNFTKLYSQQLAQYYQGPEDYYRKNLFGYAAEEYVSHFEDAPRRKRRVFAICCKELTFQFKRHGVTLIGDYFGPERYADFGIALHENKLDEFLARFGVDAVLLSKHGQFSSHEIDQAISQLRAAGFRQAGTLDDVIVLTRDEHGRA